MKESFKQKNTQLLEYKTILYVTIIFLIALALRLYMIKFNQCIETDGVAYVKIAKEIFINNTISHKVYPPMYPIFIGISSLFIKNYEMAGRIISAIFGSLIILPVFMICKKIYSKQTAYMTSILIIFYPPLVEFSTKVLSESSFIFFFVIFFWISLLAMQNNRTISFALCGIIIGILYLIRPEGLGFLPYLVCAYLIISLKNKRPNKFLLIKNIFTFSLVSLTIILPYMIFVGGISGKTDYLYNWSKATGKENVTFEADKFSQKHSASDSNFFIKEIINEPIEVLKRFIINAHIVHKYIFPSLLPATILIMLVFGIIQIKFKYKELYIFFAWLPYVFVFFLYIESRYFIPLVPLFLIFVARGIQYSFSLIHTKFKNVGYSIIFSTILTVVIMSILPFTFRPIYRPDKNVIHKEAGIWLKNNYKTPLNIVDRTPYIAFYSNSNQIRLPIGNYKEILKYSKEKMATHLVIDNEIITKLRPNLSFLISKNCIPEELRLIKTFTCNDKQILLYEFKQ